MYHKRKCFWRNSDQRKTPCAAFIYIRDKSIPDALVKTWEELGKPWSEETVLMKYIDDRSGGWKGEQYYWNHYEPDFFNLEQNSAYMDKSLLKTKDICYLHFNLRSVGGFLRQIDSKNITMECFK